MFIRVLKHIYKIFYLAMALNSLFSADVPLRRLLTHTHSLTAALNIKNSKYQEKGF